MSVQGLVEVRSWLCVLVDQRSFPGIPECPGTQARVTDLSKAKSLRA